MVKRYTSESGTAKVDGIFGDPEKDILISRLGAVEWHSVLARKARAGEITRGAYQKARGRFYADVRTRRLRLAGWDQQCFRRGIRLLKQWGLSRALRTLDALQLAAALILHERGELDRFVCADATLCDIARAEGLSVLNPED